LLGTREWVLHVDLHVCTVGTSIKIPVTPCKCSSLSTWDLGTWGGSYSTSRAPATCSMPFFLLPSSSSCSSDYSIYWVYFLTNLGFAVTLSVTKLQGSPLQKQI
jgi:hypothetical protein